MKGPEHQLGLTDAFVDIYPAMVRAADVRSARIVRLLSVAALDREDVQQEIFIGVWTALPRFDPTRASLPTFIERVAAAKVASLVRRTAASSRKKSDDYHAPESVNVFVSMELRLDLHHVLCQLDARDRRVLQLLAEHTPAQIARTIRVSRPAVYRSIRRIRKACMAAGLK